MNPTRGEFVVGALASLAATPPRAARRLVTGVNLAGLEFNSGRIPGRLDHDYVAPTTAELEYYASKGARAVRLPFLWERLQPTLDGPFNEPYWRLITELVSEASARSMRVILDPHQYGRRRIDGSTHIIGESERVTARHFAAFWSALARRCRNLPELIFELQNEPHDQDRATLVEVQNAAIAAIRFTGAEHLILVPGSAWTGAHSWISSGNSEALLAVQDPAHHFAFAVHQYLDANSSGTNASCASGAGQRLSQFTSWAKRHHKQGFLSEFGAGAGQTCLHELETMLQHMRDNRDVWQGWTCWGAGPWWPEDYPLRLTPADLRAPQDRPQLQILQRYFE